MEILTQEIFEKRMAAEIKARLALLPEDIGLHERLDFYFSLYQLGDTIEHIVSEIATKFGLTYIN